jgi:hypothetical protein
MEDVSLRIRSGRALLDSPSTWQTGEIRNPPAVAESPVSGSTRDVRRPVEKSSQDVSVGSLPFDPSVLSHGGCASDVRSDEPGIDLNYCLPVEPSYPDGPVEPRYDQSELPAISAEQKKQEEETRQEMQTVDTPKISLVKHNQVKALALELMAERFTFNGKKKFTRVSDQFCEALERFLYTAIVSAIKRHPSSGKVIKEF